MAQVIYIKLKHHKTVQMNEKVYLRDIAWIQADEEVKRKLEQLFVSEVKKEDLTYKVLDIFTIIEKLRKIYPEYEIETIGPAQTILKLQKKHSKIFPLYVVFIWCLLFIGSAMAIVNFHYDVSMEEVQERIHYMITGEKGRSILWLQIPYSLGLGFGMILFFNHIFKKKLNEEPSPLDIEMHNYDEDIRRYVTYHENELVERDED
ncbi:stage V sporulation protein AA [Allobacillus sp. GCM10007491]|uniref:Stage V sporulation protein AA n=1 Tax=Allobacillus saliphilus TaxID=2912308 RepID=A0A941CVI4_9BACI|nr:stage V sporulation protein AA [Allobacillus saliphilus]MBR7553306.1 stage V sporulation protein AA [Allobacillus saliphilus]